MADCCTSIRMSRWRKLGLPAEVVGVLSYDENPGMQAIANTAPDLPPVPGRHASWGRDHEDERHGTLLLRVEIDLLSGEVLGLVRERHRSAEFIEFLQVTIPRQSRGPYVWGRSKPHWDAG